MQTGNIGGNMEVAVNFETAWSVTAGGIPVACLAGWSQDAAFGGVLFIFGGIVELWRIYTIGAEIIPKIFGWRRKPEAAFLRPG